MADIAEVYQEIGDNESRIWKLLAYAGRYGHQSVQEMKQLPSRELQRLVRHLNEIVQEENTPAPGARPHHED